MKKNKKGGFTLLELLIVIAIIAILSVALVLVLNPSEILKKTRDGQRISDLSTIKSAIGIYMTSWSPVYLGGTSNAICKTLPSDPWGAGTLKISYSLPLETEITDTTLDGGTVGSYRQVAKANLGLTDGNGWIPVNLNNITGGSPISNFPVDPTNTVPAGELASGFGTTTLQTLVYRYGCSTNPLAFEIDAQLESTAYTSTNDMRASDGGNNANLYETGTNLSILGTGTDF